MKHSLRIFSRLGALLPGALLALATRAQPVVTGLDPAAAPAGATVVINGTGFAATADQNAVFFGAARARVTGATPTRLTVTVPVGASSVAPVGVTDLAQQLAGSSLTCRTPFFTLTFAGPALNAATYQATTYPVGTSRLLDSALATAEFNGDGYADFAVLTDGQLLLVLSDGHGGYNAAPVRLAAGTFPNALKAADVDANGTADLLVGASGQLLLLRNLGQGQGFTTPAVLDLGPELLPNNRRLPVEVQDMNGDGRPDLLALTAVPNAPGTTRLVELRNNGAGFDAPRSLLVDKLQAFVAADFTQDGRLDVLATRRNVSASEPAQFLLLARLGTNAGYAAPEATGLPNTYFTDGPLLADLNADGRPDLVLGGSLPLPGGTQVGTGVLVALRTDTGFVLQGPYGERPPNGVSTVPAVADANGDGLADAFTTVNGPAFTVLPGQAGGSFGPGPRYGNGVVADLVTGDFDNDGRTDAATFDAGNGTLTVFRYTGASPAQPKAPTLDVLPDLALDEDAPAQSIALTGISTGGNAGQAVTLSAVSADPNLVPTPTIRYFSPTSTGTLHLRPAPSAFGTCLITVTASNGQSPNGTLARTFRVTVKPVNHAPTLDPLPDVVLTKVENGAAAIALTLSGITSGAGNENQLLSLSSVVSLNDPTNGGGGFSNGITYTSPASSGLYRLNVNVFGGPPRLLATVTVTVNDGQPANNTTSRMFRVYYNPGGTAPDQPATAPTLDVIADVLADRALASHVPVALTGIAAGDPHPVLPLALTATSSDPELVRVGPVSYTSPAATGALPYTVSSARGGTALVSVTISNGLAQNGSLTRSFRVTVPLVPLLTAGRHAQGTASIDLYPNPAAAGRFWLASPQTGPLEVAVLDLAGRPVFTARLAAGQARQVQLPPATAAGLYLVRVRSAQETITRRLVVE